MLYCSGGKHKLQVVQEVGKKPYLRCRCGHNELIPGAEVYDPNDPRYRSLTGKEILLCIFAGSAAAIFFGYLIHMA